MPVGEDRIETAGIQMRQWLTHRKQSEFFFRGKQFLWNLTDRLRVNAWKAIPRESRSRKTVPQGNSFLNPEILKLIRERYGNFPSWRKKNLAKGTNVLEHRFDLLGNEGLSFGSRNGKIDWHLDPIHNIQVPLVWWRKIDLSDPEVVGDPKIVWEFNRHQHLVSLAKAYVLTEEDSYRREFMDQISSWCDANPPKYGINWASSLELAYRSIAWIWVVQMFHAVKPLPEAFLHLFCNFLSLQAEHIEHNLSVYYSPNTHLTGEALGLFYIGTFFKGTGPARVWTEKGKEILLECLSKHVLSDGGYMERSLWYHRYSLDIYLHFLLLAKANDIALPGEVEEKILQLGEFLAYASTPDRGFPLIGDDDGGRLLPLDSLGGNDLRGLFSTLAVLFSRGDFKYLSEGYQEETLWLLGPDSQETYDRVKAQPPSTVSRAFKETGYFFMRSGWSPEANYMAFDCGPHGWLNCGHAHADLLSFQLCAGGSSIVIDPGTYTYSGGMRDYFRGADAHSTLKVDGFYPAAPRGPFHWAVVPRHELIEWSTSDEYDYVSGRLKGDFGWGHIREVFFVKPSIFFIVDTVGGQGERKVEIRFPLYGKNWNMVENRCVTRPSNPPCTIEVFAPGDSRLSLIDSWVSTCYGHKEPSFTLMFKENLFLPCRIGSLINLSGAPLRVEFVTVPEEGKTHFKIISRETDSPIFIY